jgi:hypothetical protein
MKAAIVVTSINDCSQLLDGYLKNFAEHGREAQIYLIPDRKTPQQHLPTCVQVPDESWQTKVLKDVGFRPEDIPWNSDNRRNVGYLMALADGAEMTTTAATLGTSSESTPLRCGSTTEPEVHEAAGTTIVGSSKRCRVRIPEASRISKGKVTDSRRRYSKRSR